MSHIIYLLFTPILSSQKNTGKKKRTKTEASLPTSPTFLRMLRLGKLLRAVRVVRLSCRGDDSHGIPDVRSLARQKHGFRRV